MFTALYVKIKLVKLVKVAEEEKQSKLTLFREKKIPICNLRLTPLKRGKT